MFVSVWERYSKEQKEEYKKFLQMYGALSNLFRQKKGDPIPYLDSKYQETIYAKVFGGENVDIGNTPHDILSVFDNERVGIGIKTWMNSKPSFQKVMQIKSYRHDLDQYLGNLEELVLAISRIKNERMQSDYVRLGLSEDKNIYHYVTRDENKLLVNECLYPLIDIDNLQKIKGTETSLTWSDGKKEYKYTYSDSQIWQKFGGKQSDDLVLDTFDVKILENPFDFLFQSFTAAHNIPIIGKNLKIQDDKADFEEIYLPLYSYRSKNVEQRSGLNAWNAEPKNRNSSTPRPLNEIYIPIPLEFHKKYPNFFTSNIMSILSDKNSKRPEIRFHLVLPNGQKIPALITADNFKHLQSGSRTEKDKNGKLYGQNALGQWLLVDVLGLKERQPVTREWLQKKNTDSVRLWRKKDDYSNIYIDLAPIDSFEAFMNNDPILQNDEI